MSYDLPEKLAWDFRHIADPVPEWWLREIGIELQREILVIRLETAQRVLQAQAEGFAAAAKLIAGPR